MARPNRLESAARPECDSMTATGLVNLRRQQRVTLRRIEKMQSVLTEYQAKLAAIEAKLAVLAPELPLEIKRRKRNLIFRPGELPRLAMKVLREACAPIPTRLIAIRCLAAKGLTYPGPGTMKRTRLTLAQIFLGWERRGWSTAWGASGRG